MKLSALAAGIGAAALLAGSAAVAQPTVSVTAHARGDKVRTLGPDQADRYTLQVGASDLDLTTEAGMRTLRARVARGTAELCDAAAEGPQLAGFYDAGARHCVANTLAAAAPQIARARQAASEGRPVARLDLAAAVALR